MSKTRRERVSFAGCAGVCICLLLCAACDKNEKPKNPNKSDSGDKHAAQSEKAKLEGEQLSPHEQGKSGFSAIEVTQYPSLNCRIGGKDYTAKRVDSTVAFRVFGNRRTPIEVALYSSHPFTGTNMGKRDFAFGKPMIIRVASAEGDTLIPTPDSRVPIWFDTSSFPTKVHALVHAVGVKWEFQERGITFVGGGSRYTTQRKGAFVEFTEGGLVVEGLTRTGLTKESSGQ